MKDAPPENYLEWGVAAQRAGCLRASHITEATEMYSRRVVLVLVRDGHIADEDRVGRAIEHMLLTFFEHEHRWCDDALAGAPTVRRPRHYVAEAGHEEEPLDM